MAIAGAALAWVGHAGVASAQTDSATLAAARRGLLSDAQAASTSGDHARALTLAERAGQIEMTPSLRLFIAQELRSLGRTADAMGSAELCVRDARAATMLRNRDAIVSQCQGLVDSLGHEVGSLVLNVPSAVPDGTIVQVNGTTIPTVLFGVPYRVTPGAQHVTLSGPSVRPYSVDITVAAGQSSPVALQVVRETAAVASAQPVAVAASSAPPSPAPAHVAAPERPHRRALPVGPIVTVSGGVVAAVAGIVFYVLRNGSIDTLNTQYCSTVPGGYACDATDTARSTYQSAVTYDIAADVAFGVAGVAIVGGILWWVLTPSTPARDRASAFITPTNGGAILGIGGTL